MLDVQTTPLLQLQPTQLYISEKLGMRLEGRLRDKEYFEGRWWDTLLYAILEDEWHEQRQDR